MFRKQKNYHVKIQCLTKKNIKGILEDAQKRYLSGNEDDPRITTTYSRGIPVEYATHVGDVVNKNLWSLGTSYVYRLIKSEWRIPTITDTMSDQQARDALVTFLKGSGGDDLYSLKYMVASLITNNQEKTDEAAKELIQTLTGETPSSAIKNHLSL